MKIICIGRNYAEHAKEMKAELPTEPVFFLKPDTALLKEEDFYYPDFTKELHHELEIVLKVCKAGKFIKKQFAGTYFDEIGLGIDFTARDLQSKCKQKGLPWEIAKAFDNSAPIGKFLKKENINLKEIKLELKVNGEIKQSGSSKDLLFQFDELIEYISRFISLRVGDLIFTGTPSGVGPVKIGDTLQGYLNGEELLKLKIK